MALHSFKAAIEDGKIVVTANPELTTKANKSRPPRLLASGTEVGNSHSDTQPVVNQSADPREPSCGYWWRLGWLPHCRVSP
jgi:hypothetical protein